MGQALVISGTMTSSPGALSSSFMSSRASHRWQPEKWTQAEQRLVSRNFLSSSLLKRPMGAAIASKGAKICSNVELAARRRGLLMTQSGLAQAKDGQECSGSDLFVPLLHASGGESDRCERVVPILRRQAPISYVRRPVALTLILVK